MKPLLVLALSLLVTLPSCGAGVPHPTELDRERVAERWPEVSLASLERGRELYVARCGGCHQLFAPSSFGAERWEDEVRKMSARAHLDRQQELLILQYLASVSKAEQEAATDNAPAKGH